AALSALAIASARIAGPAIAGPIVSAVATTTRRRASPSVICIPDVPLSVERDDPAEALVRFTGIDIETERAIVRVEDVAHRVVADPRGDVVRPRQQPQRADVEID